jgi:hypothetical protein
MLSRFLETLMKKFARKIGRTDQAPVRETAAGTIEQMRGSSIEKGAYATKEELKRSVVKIAKEHRSALEWLADK